MASTFTTLVMALRLADGSVVAMTYDDQAGWSVPGEVGHEEHEDRLEWLGIDRPDQHDPAHFDPDEVNDAFTALLQNSRRQK